MRIAVVCAAGGRGEIPDYVNSLAKGMSLMGHRVDVINAWTDDGMRLPGYEYIAVCVEPSFWGGRIPLVIPKVLAAGSSVAGRKSGAFIKKTSPFYMNRAIANLMKAMEKEGMIVNWSDFILNASHAEELGKKIGA